MGVSQIICTFVGDTHLQTTILKNIAPYILLATALTVLQGHRMPEPINSPSAHQGIDSLFVNAPTKVLPLLTRNSRMDMIDYLDYSQPAIVTNRFGGKSEMTTLTDSLIRIRMTDISTWQMQLKVSPVTADTIIEVTHTVCYPDTAVFVTRYSRDWSIIED